MPPELHDPATDNWRPLVAIADAAGRIEYGREGMILRCPWHGWEFDVDSGRSLCEPERRRVAAYAVREEDGRLLVTVGSSGRGK